MISKNNQIRNALFETFYEKLNECIQDAHDYTDAKTLLSDICDKLATICETHLKETGDGLSITIDGYRLIDLFDSQNGDFFLSVSPPDHSDDFDNQITLLRKLISTL